MAGPDDTTGSAARGVANRGTSDRISAEPTPRGAPATTARAPVRPLVVDPSREKSILASVHFDTNSEVLRDDAKRALAAPLETVRRVLQLRPVQLLFIGYADHRGAERHNLRLGERRADAVARHFAALHASRNYSWGTASAGESDDPGTETTAERLQPYRRVDIIARPAIAPAPKPTRGFEGIDLGADLGDWNKGPFEHDMAGRAIFSRWMEGLGDWTIRDDASWTRYMTANPQLTRQAADRLRAVLAPLGHGKAPQSNVRNLTTRNGVVSFELEDRFHAQLYGGESPVGYKLLGGSNADVGDFQIRGRVTAEPRKAETRVRLDLEYVWNDKIDPNFRVPSDWVSTLPARLLSGGTAKNFVLRIHWHVRSELVFEPNSYRIRSWSGWPFEDGPTDGRQQPPDPASTGTAPTQTKRGP